MAALDTNFFTGLAAFAVANSVTPGPNNLMMMASGANFGWARTLPHMAGVIFGFALLTAVCGLGLGVLMAAFPPLHAALYWGGSGYLLYLAWRIATARGFAGAEVARPQRFLEVVAFQWVNPKAWTGAIGAIAAFSKPDAYYAALAAIVATFALVNIPVTSLWTGGGMAMKRLLQSPAALRAFNVMMGALLAASIPPVIDLERHVFALLARH